MKVENVSFKYEKQNILNDINFKVKEKEMLGIVGESGAGKSTLLRLMGNLIEIQEGSISDQDKMGFIFQNFNLFPHLNVYDNITLSLRVNKTMDKDAINLKAVSLLKDFGIEDKQLSYADELSGGERQRVAIIRALMLEPKLLLVDEATSSLDPKRRDEFMDILTNLKNDGMSIVIVSHDHDVLKAYCDRLIYLDDGQITKTEIL